MVLPKPFECKLEISYLSHISKPYVWNCLLKGRKVTKSNNSYKKLVYLNWKTRHHFCTKFQLAWILHKRHLVLKLFRYKRDFTVWVSNSTLHDWDFFLFYSITWWWLWIFLGRHQLLHDSFFHCASKELVAIASSPSSPPPPLSDIRYECDVSVYGIDCVSSSSCCCFSHCHALLCHNSNTKTLSLERKKAWWFL